MAAGRKKKRIGAAVEITFDFFVWVCVKIDPRLADRHTFLSCARPGVSDDRFFTLCRALIDISLSVGAADGIVIVVAFASVGRRDAVTVLAFLVGFAFGIRRAAFGLSDAFAGYYVARV